MMPGVLRETWVGVIDDRYALAMWGSPLRTVREMRHDISAGRSMAVDARGGADAKKYMNASDMGQQDDGMNSLI